MSRTTPRLPRIVSPGTPFTEGLDAGYAHGYDIGYTHGYTQAEADMEAAWARVAQYVRRTAEQPCWDELQRRRGEPSNSTAAPQAAACRHISPDLGTEQSRRSAVTN
jgi:hypothetical protein